MGVFFYTKSVALIEDVPLSEEYIGASAETDLRRDIDTGFQQVSFIMNFHPSGMQLSHPVTDMGHKTRFLPSD